MSYRKKISRLLISDFCIFLLVISIVRFSVPLGLCKYESMWGGCSSLKFELFIWLIFVFLLTLLPLLFILLFCKEATYHSWKKFSLWYFGIVGLLLSPIIFTTLFEGFSGGSGGGLMSNPASIEVGEDVLILGLYFFLSLIVIIRGQLRKPKAVTGKK